MVSITPSNQLLSMLYWLGFYVYLVYLVVSILSVQTLLPRCLLTYITIAFDSLVQY